MPYVIRERLPTAGLHMYLLCVPVSDNSVGSWIANKKKAQKFKTIQEANTVSRMLSANNMGVVEHYSPKENTVSDSDWVIKSNITNEYLVQAQIYREPELWSYALKEAKRFKTATEARDYSSDYILGKPSDPNDKGQALDMDYIAVTRPKKEGKSSLFRNTAESNYHFVVRCDGTLRYVKKLVLVDRTVDWTTDIREAKQYKYRTSAETASRKIRSSSISTSVHVVDSRSHRIVQIPNAAPMEKKMPEKRNFRVNMHHAIGYQIEVTYTEITEMQALDRMFEEAKTMPRKPFISGRIKALVAGGSDARAIDVKSM
jgi:hypothetical protein